MIKSKNILFLFLFVFSIKTSFGQESLFEKVTKQYSLTLLGANNVSTTFDNTAKTGFGIELDYAWKLSGYNKKKNVYLSLPLGYQVFSSPDATNLKVLQYGWQVRHELSKNKNWTPYLAYSLLLNQTWLEGVKGSVFGHQTRFSFGVNKRIKAKLFLNFLINYSMIRLPSLNKEKADRFSRLSVGIGVIFG